MPVTFTASKVWSPAFVILRDVAKTTQTGGRKADAQQWLRDADTRQKHEAHTMEDPTVGRKEEWSKRQLCVKTQRKHWDWKELLCASHEVTGSEERNTRMESSEERSPRPAGARRGRGPVTVRISESPGMGSMEWGRSTRTPLTTNTATAREGGGRPAPPAERRGGEEGSGEPSSRLTSSGADKVTVGELRLRGRRIWGSIRWLLLFVADPDAPSSASYVGGKHKLAACEALPARVWTQWQRGQRSREGACGKRGGADPEQRGGARDGETLQGSKWITSRQKNQPQRKGGLEGRYPLGSTGSSLENLFRVTHTHIYIYIYIYFFFFFF